MSRVFNFSAGPAMIPEAVLQRAKEEITDWQGAGLSVMEMSHRGKDFMSIAAKAEADLRELMVIPDNYKVLFLQGGASLQFSAIPINLMTENGTADYLLTGTWGKKAIAEAKRFGDVNVVVDTSESKFSTLPAEGEYQLTKGASYVHYTPNETIEGVEFNYVPETNGVPLVADMSSTILSRPIDVSKFALIYAGAQKNIGPAGLTMVIVREDLLANPLANTPTMLQYATHANADSMYNTPPTYGWYLAGLVFEWLKEKGGIEAMGKINERKAMALYSAIDSSGFYANPVDKPYRSWMNVPFTLANAALDADFLKLAANEGLQTLKGHRLVGGMRASIYNAMPEAGVQALIDFMAEFERTKG